jgi:hypothetical protein
VIAVAIEAHGLSSAVIQIKTVGARIAAHGSSSGRIPLLLGVGRRTTAVGNSTRHKALNAFVGMIIHSGGLPPFVRMKVV